MNPEGQGEFELTLAGLVHDLNNVLQTISEAAELLSEDPQWKKLAVTIERNVQRGKRLVDSVRETGAGSFELQMIADSAVEFARDFLQAARRRPFEFKVEIEPGVRIRGNPVAWERVLVNLVINAAQAMGQPGAYGRGVEIRAGATADGGVEICVADEGPGIPEEILPRIFEPRFSTHAAHKGLGLHIVESVVRENGGTVAARNREEGKGAEVLIRLNAN